MATPQPAVVAPSEGAIREDMPAGRRWAGWVPHDRMYGFIAGCNVGVVPHVVSPHIETTIPNKIFDYMSCGIPVVASDARPLSRVLYEVGCGRTFASGDPGDLAKAIIDVRDDAVAMGQRGMAAVHSTFNWGQEIPKLKAAVARVLGSDFGR